MQYIENNKRSYFTHPSNILTPERSTRSAMKVLLINTRSHQSDLLEDGADRNVDPQKFFLDMLNRNDDLRKEGVPAFEVVQLKELKLSADQSPDDWRSLAALIEKNYYKYCGFVVQNGTDNMITTATALSFMLKNLGKPVIFTGSLIPGNFIYTDMKRNLILALSCASCGLLCEVCILFDEKLFRANCAIKVSRASLKPFDTPHCPPLASIHGGAMSLHRPLLRPHPHGKLRVMPNMDAKVLVLQLGPAARKEAMLFAVAQTDAKAIIMRCFGSGNGPSRFNYMKDVLACAMKRDIVVVICTQNRYGTVDLSEYETGRQLMEAGAISAGDMTHEATFIKLKYLFGLNMCPQEVRKYLSHNLRGERTMPSAKL